MLKLLRTSIKGCLNGVSGWRALLIVATFVKLSCEAYATDPGNVVKDGQFVLGMPGAPFTTYQKGQTFGDWKVDVGDVDVNVGYFATPDDATNSVDLNGREQGRGNQPESDYRSR